jgi:AcrR family transcriptional regulator
MARTKRLDREHVLRAALALADAEGLENLSFRRLASRLDVTPMALYNHVRDKDDLLDGIGDVALSELELPRSQRTSWQHRLRTAARSFRTLLTAHPAAASVFLSRPLFTPAALESADAVLGIFRSAGFSPARSVVLYQQLVRYVLALALLDQSGRSPSSARARSTSHTLGELSPDRYPHLHEAAAHLVAEQDADEVFETGLDIFVAGVERRRPS